MREQEESFDPIFDCNSFDLAEDILARASDEPVRPEDFDSYRFLDTKPLGSGAMSDVWLAEEQGVDRPVAIKLLQRTSEPDVWAGREIKRLGALEHQFIARLYNHGVLVDGTPWLAMELVEGAPLDEYCQKRQCSLHDRLELFRRVCEGVAYAHGRGIIHGDLKPSNILVKNNGEPKLLDFGLAEQFQNRDGSPAESSSALGFTPAYAAPEQFRGEPVSVAIDVYALGVILYGLLAGRLPFEDSQVTYADLKAIKMSERNPGPPSEAAQPDGSPVSASAAEWRDLDALCMMAMEGNVRRRYKSVEALLEDLDRLGGHQPLEARQPYPWTYRLGKFLRRRRAPLLVSAGVFAAIAILAGLFAWRLQAERNTALAEAARTQEVTEFFLTAFNHAAEDALPGEKARMVKLFLDRGTRDARSLTQDPAIQADIYRGFGTMYQEWGSLHQAERLLREAVAMDQSRFPANDSRVIRAQLALGHLLEERGAYREAIAIGDEVLRVPPSQADYPRTLTLLSDAHFHLGNYAVADSLNQRALAADQQLYGPNHPQVANDLMDFGNLEHQRGRYPEAEKYYRQALAINESHFGKDSPEAADSASYVAMAMYYQGGRESELSRLLKGALASLEKTRGEIDSRVAFTVAQLGSVAIETGNLDDAAADFERSAGIYRAVRGDAHQSVAIELANLASVQLKKKDYSRAEAGFRDVIERFLKILPPDNPNIGIARIKLGHALLSERRYRDSEVELRKGYEILAKQTSPSVDWLVHAREDLVAAYQAMHEPQKAVAFQTELQAAPK